MLLLHHLNDFPVLRFHPFPLLRQSIIIIITITIVTTTSITVIITMSHVTNIVIIGHSRTFLPLVKPSSGEQMISKAKSCLELQSSSRLLCCS